MISAVLAAVVSLDHLVSEREQPIWHTHTKQLCGFKVDYQFKLRRLLDG
jgi:hypothetical protein